MARRTLLAALQSYRRRSQRPVDPLRAVDTDRVGLPISQERTRHTSHLPSTGTSRRRAHSDRLSRLLLASDAEAAPVAARPGVDTDGGVRKVSRNQNDRCVDSYGRSTVVDSAALHATFRRHQAAHRKTKTAAAESAATAPGRAKRELRNRGADRSVGGPFVVETFQQPRLIPKHLTGSEVPNWESSVSALPLRRQTPALLARSLATQIRQALLLGLAYNIYRL